MVVNSATRAQQQSLERVPVGGERKLNLVRANGEGDKAAPSKATFKPRHVGHGGGSLLKLFAIATAR
jgi:hypothetical protein